MFYFSKNAPAIVGNPFKVVLSESFDPYKILEYEDQGYIVVKALEMINHCKNNYSLTLKGKLASALKTINVFIADGIKEGIFA